MSVTVHKEQFHWQMLLVVMFTTGKLLWEREGNRNFCSMFQLLECNSSQKRSSNDFGFMGSVAHYFLFGVSSIELFLNRGRA